MFPIKNKIKNIYKQMIWEMKPWKCSVCNWEGNGIVAISSHWAECGGKPFHDGLLELKKYNKLTLKNVEKLRKKYDNII